LKTTCGTEDSRNFELAYQKEDNKEEENQFWPFGDFFWFSTFAMQSTDSMMSP